MNGVRILAVAALLAAPLPVEAQQRAIPLDTLRVEASSRAGAEIATGTRAVEVIGADRIRRSPARTVGELLQWAFGVDVMPRSPALVDVAIRGSSFEQVLVLVDGVRASDAQTGHFDLDLAVPLDQIERIEIVRGSGSALHGADAMGGVIHLVTRKGRGSSARVEAGSFETRALSLSHALRAGGVRADGGLELQRSDGHRVGTDYRTALGRVSLGLPLAGRALEADFGYAARDFGASRFYGDYPSYEETRTATASLAWRAAPGARLALEPALSVRSHDDDFVLWRDEPARYRNQHSTLQAGGEIVARYAASPLLRVAAGGEAYVDRLRSRRLGDREEARGALLGELVAGRVGALTATAGLRLDHHEAFGEFWSPSVAAAWWPAAGLRVRSSLGRAFRTPTWTERYYQDPANIGSPDLRPERAWTAEAGFDAYPLRALRVAGAAFVRDASNLIDWAKPAGAPSSTPFRTRNVKDATFRGVEAEVEVDDLYGVRVAAQGSWLSLDASDAAGFASKYALRPLSEVLALSADRAVTRGLTLGLRAQRARRTPLPGRTEAPYLLLDGRAGYQLARGRVYLDARNLTDEGYLDVVGGEAAGRALLIGVELGSARR